MSIACIGLDYHDGDLELRGKVAFTESRYRESYACFLSCDGIFGCIILSTCNRTELYFHYDMKLGGADSLFSLFAVDFKLQEGEMEKFFVYENERAIRHLFRVAAGLESMVIGEDQILNQVKEAQSRAVEMKAADSVLNRVFREAITCAKEIKTYTCISQNKTSIASIAVDMAEKHLHDLRDKKMLIIGIGEMSRIAIKHLHDKGAAKIYLANRSLDKSAAMLEEFSYIEPVAFDRRYEYLGEVDAVFSATGAPHTVLKHAEFQPHYGGEPLLLLDMAVPRDIELSIGKLDNVTLYDIDHFTYITEENLEKRQKLAKEAEKMVDEGIEKLERWIEEMHIHNLLSKVDSFVDDQAAEHAEALLYKLEYGERLLRSEAKDYALQLTGRILKKMVLKIKDMPKHEGDQYTRMLEALLE